MSTKKKTLWVIIVIILLVSLLFLILPSQWFWISWEVIAAGLVAVGCCGEWRLTMEEKPKSEAEAEHHRRELRFVLMVSIGVTAEVIGLGHTINEGFKLEKEVAKAVEKASKADERTALTESNNLVLRSNVVALELKLQPRKITMEQRTNFINLAQFIPKVPIKILIGQEGRDTEDFASDIRETLTMSGFKTNADAEAWGINRDRTLVVKKNFDTTNNPDLLFFSNTGDSPDRQHLVTIYGSQLPNGSFLPTQIGTNESEIYSAVKVCFESIGIRCNWQRAAGTRNVKIGEYLIFIVVK